PSPAAPPPSPVAAPPSGGTQPVRCTLRRLLQSVGPAHDGSGSSGTICTPVDTLGMSPRFGYASATDFHGPPAGGFSTHPNTRSWYGRLGQPRLGLQTGRMAS